MRRKATLWFVSEAYYPDEVGTAFYMTTLAESLAARNAIGALCGAPIYNARGAAVPRREIRKGVSIIRCRGTTFNKDRFLLRVVNLTTISLSMFFQALWAFKRNDRVIVVTSPPLLPFTIRAACALKGAKCILRIDDVYPETLVAAGMLNPGSFPSKVIHGLNKRLYRSMDAIVVLGRDMEQLAGKKLGTDFGKITIIPNWADIEAIRPRPKAGTSLARDLGLAAEFVVLCAGNMGRAQAIETMFEAAARLNADPGIRFVFIGTGAKRRWMNRQAAEQGLKQVTILDQRPRSDQDDFLNACDVGLISLMPGMTGAGVPSRMYNVMAAGKPIIALAPAESELCRVVFEEKIGWVASPDDGPALAEVIRSARANPGLVSEMGARARRTAEEKYSPPRIIRKYEELIRSFDA